MGRRGAYRVLVRRPEEKRPLGRPRRRCEHNFKMDLQEMEREGLDCIDLAHSVENSLWKRLWTCCKTDYLLQLLLLLMVMMVITMIMIMIDLQKVTLSSYTMFLMWLLPVSVLEMLLHELNPNASADITTQTLPPAFLYLSAAMFHYNKSSCLLPVRPPLITTVNILHLRCW